VHVDLLSLSITKRLVSKTAHAGQVAERIYRLAAGHTRHQRGIGNRESILGWVPANIIILEAL
jgi:hypothetical protein